MRTYIFQMTLIVVAAVAASLGFYFSQVAPLDSEVIDNTRGEVGEKAELADTIVLDEPLSNTEVSSPLNLSGSARGPWYFEASFSARIVDDRGNVLGKTAVQAQDDWMTESFVPFSTTLHFARPETKRGTLILEKANPSGLPRNAESLRVPVKFSDTAETEMLDTSEWETYSNEQFGFRISHPADWEVMEAPDGKITPMFNLYDPTSLDRRTAPPLTHHDRATHVSVYPHGIPTEGVFASTIDRSIVPFSEPLRSVQEYFLADGKRFATNASFSSQPDSWNESGFVWGAVRVTNQSTDCLRNGERVSQNECDPLFGDELIWHGSIDTQSQQTVRTILSTFEFIN